MEPALLRFGLLPPPAAGAHVLAGHGRPGAGGAADGAIALFIETVVGHVVGIEVSPHLLLAPLGKRVEFLQSMGRVVFLQWQRGARARLRAAQARDPRPLARQRALERLGLADGAALPAQLDAFVEGVAAV